MKLRVRDIAWSEWAWETFKYVVPFLIYVAAVHWMPTDSTDKDVWTRSGMKLFTDYETGLQYLGGPGGGLYPRLDGDGVQMSVKIFEKVDK